MKFSLILPTYNVEKYITACLESCCQQVGISPTDYEIIIVNDETPDGSIEVAQRVIDKYPDHKWQIVNRENGGLSAARNSGILAAHGDYLWFIDSDDYIDRNALSVLSDVIADDTYDIINFTHKTVFKNNRIVGGDKYFEPRTCTGTDYLACTNFLSAWTCLYRRSYIKENNLRFKEGVIWEDSEFNIRAYTLTDNCYCISDALYYYIRREDSISDLRATGFSTNSRVSNAYGLDEYFQASSFCKGQENAAYIRIASTLVSAIAGLPELEKTERSFFRKLILAKKHAYWRIMMKCKDYRSALPMLCFAVWPSLAEKILNKKIHEAIERSTK